MVRKRNDTVLLSVDRQNIQNLPHPSLRQNGMIDYMRLPEIKRLVHRIASTQNQDPYKSLIILSEYPKEGRSFLVSLLALAYASILKSRVLILDTVSKNKEDSFHFGSIRHDNINSKFNLKDPLHSDHFADTSHQRNTGVDLIITRSLVPASHNYLPHTEQTDESSTNNYRSGEVELIQTVEFLMKPFITGLSNSYDLILLDTCAMSSSCGELFDPLVLARQIERAVLLLSPLSRNKGASQKIQNRLEQERVSLMGVINNRYSTFSK